MNENGFEVFEDAIDDAIEKTAQPLRCSLKWHKWSKWTMPEELLSEPMQIHTGGFIQAINGISIPVQKRTCILCHIIQTRPLHGISVGVEDIDDDG